LLVLLCSGSSLEARHWRHHHHHDGYFVWHDEEVGPAKERESPKRDVSPPVRKEAGFSGALRQLVSSCRQAGTELKQWSADTLAQNLGTNDGQRTALDDMQSTAVQVADGLSSSCPSEPPASPSGKIKSLIEVGQAYLAAMDAIRPKMDAFYGSLTDEQKARLVALNLSNRGSDENAASGAGSDGTAFCDQWAQALRSWPIRQMEARVTLSDAQHAALFDVGAAMYRAADALTHACPKQMPLSPPAQFDARRKQVAALLEAIDSIGPVLDRFSGSLNSSQNAALNTVVNAQ
jgi:hypothetical protein